MDYLLRQAAEEDQIDIFRTVTDMRYQRANFVQMDVSVGQMGHYGMVFSFYQ